MSEVRDFWSRRKARVAEEEAAAELAVEARAIEAHQADKTDSEILADLGLPDPETLGPGDDFSAFMAKTVPEHLRRLALRRLWPSNPVLANVDGLLEYGEDYTDAACVIKNLATSYQVGKGMTAHVEEMARQAALDASEEPEEEAAPEIEDDQGDDQEEMLATEEPTPEEDVVAVGVAEADGAFGRSDAAEESAPEEYVPASRRRMRFSFHEEEVARV